MTEDDLIKRLLLSRRTMWKYRTFTGWPTGGDASDKIAIVDTEIAILRDLQWQFPGRHGHIERIVRGWEEAKATLRGRMH
jgi:hypothetical protein